MAEEYRAGRAPSVAAAVSLSSSQAPHVKGQSWHALGRGDLPDITVVFV